jgi:hypothetical protein
VGRIPFGLRREEHAARPKRWFDDEVCTRVRSSPAVMSTPLPLRRKTPGDPSAADGSYSASAAAPFVDGDASRGSGIEFETSIRLERRLTPKQIAGTKCALA